MKALKIFTACMAINLAWAAAACAADSGAGDVGFRTFAVLIGTVVALFALAWAARKYGPYAKVKRSMGLDVVSQIPVGPKAHLSLVRVGRSILVLGVTQNQVSFIKELEGSEFEKAFDHAQSQGGNS
jgi:flagellar biosynthetic protein FliO